MPDLVRVSLGALPELELFSRDLAVLDVDAEIYLVSSVAGVKGHTGVGELELALVGDEPLLLGHAVEALPDLDG